MSDSTFELPSSDQASASTEPSREEVPSFGAIDIVEAFTAMRHEWRSQTRESRELADQMQAIARLIEELARQQVERHEPAPIDDQSESRQLARLIAELDHQLTRALDAMRNMDEARNALRDAEQSAIEQFFNGMNPLARWFARPLLNFYNVRRSKFQQSDHSTIEGLELVLARLRQAMQEHGIERVDVLGKPFDGDSMHAIGTAESAHYPPGYVSEQIAPCYRWKGNVLRFADVRVVPATLSKTE